MAHADNMVTARMNFEAGRIYFLQQSIFSAVWATMTGFSVYTYEEAMDQINERGSKFLVFDSGGSDVYLSEKDFQKAKNDFEQEVREDPERHKDTLEYKGYNKMK